MKLSCNIIRDLLPNYIENLTAKETEQAILEHLEECKECKEIYSQMKEEISVQNVVEVPPLKNFLKKTKWFYALEIINILSIIGILVPLIVDFAVNKKFTWSIISSVGIIYFLIGLTICWKTNKRKVITTALWESILLFPMLYIIELVINTNFLEQPVYWFWSIAVPISILWLVIIWTSIFLKEVTKLNWWSIMGIFTIASGGGTVFTNKWVEMIIKQSSTSSQAINLISAVSIGICLIMIGNIKKNRMKQ